MLRQPESGFLRVPYTQRCRVGWDESLQDGLTCNISTLGLYVAMDPQPEVGTTVSLSFPLPTGIVCVEATVTWQNVEPPHAVDDLPPGCGFRFVALLPHDRDQIEALVGQFRSGVDPKRWARMTFLDLVRVPYLMPCGMARADGTVAAGRLCYLSLQGVYVMADPLPALGEEVEVTFLLFDDTTPVVEKTVVSRHAEGPPQRVDSLPPGCLLHFSALQPGSRARLEPVVRDFIARMSILKLDEAEEG